MSALSTITGSLPNVLNLLQGSWTVQYHARKKSNETFMDKVSNIIEKGRGLIATINGLPKDSASDEWKSLDFDSFVEMNEVADSTITNQVIEGGSFRSVNKVVKPKQIKVILAKAGIGYGVEDSLAEVKKLLPKTRYAAKKTTSGQELLDKAKGLINTVLPKSSELKIDKKKEIMIPMEFRIVTPFDMISNLNLVKLDYTFKKDTGRNMLVMFLTFEEVKEKHTKVEKTTEVVSNPSDVDNQNVGVVSMVKGS